MPAHNLSDATVVLQHPASGWDGTFGLVVTALADVLTDGPVPVNVLFEVGDGSSDRLQVKGKWLSRNAGTITVDLGGAIVTIDDETIVSLSI